MQKRCVAKFGDSQPIFVLYRTIIRSKDPSALEDFSKIRSAKPLSFADWQRVFADLQSGSWHRFSEGALRFFEPGTGSVPGVEYEIVVTYPPC
jgi:hypothetical protein